MSKSSSHMECESVEESKTAKQVHAFIQQTLDQAREAIEAKTGRMFELSMNELGNVSWCGMGPEIENDPTGFRYGAKTFSSGKVSFRRHKWRVKMFETHETYEDKTVPMEPELLALNGIYDSVDDIRKKVREIALQDAQKRYGTTAYGEKLALKSFFYEDGRWKLLCGQCGHVETDDECRSQVCQKCHALLVGGRFFEDINVSGATIEFHSGGSLCLVYYLGQLIPVKD